LLVKRGFDSLPPHRSFNNFIGSAGNNWNRLSLECSDASLHQSREAFFV
jgi:hypothetical protein